MMKEISQHTMPASLLNFPSAYALHLTTQPCGSIEAVVPVSNYVEVAEVSPQDSRLIPRFKDSPAVLAGRIIEKLLTIEDQTAAEPHALSLAEQLFDEIDVFRFQLASLFESYREADDDFSSVGKWINQYNHWFSEINRMLNDKLKDSDIHSLFCDYQSSCERPLIEAVNEMTRIFYYASEPSDQIRKKKDSAKLCEYLHVLAAYETMQTQHCFDRDYLVSSSRVELAGRLGAALMAAATNFEWDGDRVTLNLHKKRRRLSKSREMLQRFSWPLNPDDIALQSVQRVLGWQFEIESSGREQSVIIDFSGVK